MASREEGAAIVTPRQHAIAELTRILSVALEDHVRGAGFQTIDIFCAVASLALNACKKARIPASAVERAFLDLLRQAYAD